MLLRLSRYSFWLAAAAAALALAAPGGRERWLAAVAMAAVAIALVLLRVAVRLPVKEAAATPSVEAAALDASPLLDAGASIVETARDAPSFESALHAVASILRSELGAHAVTVHAVDGIERDDAGRTRARLCEMLPAQPGFRTVERRVLLDGSALGRSIAEGRESGVLPGALAIPALADGRVVSVIELAGIEVRFDPQALGKLLALARVALSKRAVAPASPAPPHTDLSSMAESTSGGAVTSADRVADSGPEAAFRKDFRAPDAALAATAAAALVPRAGRSVAPAHLQASVLLVEENSGAAEETTRVVRRLGCRVTLASGMLEALRVLSRTQFDVVLVDLTTSRMNEKEASGWWRAPDKATLAALSASGAPMLAVWGDGLTVGAARLSELGFDDALCKPYDPGHMLAMLSRHRRAHAPAESRDAAAGGRTAALSTIDALDSDTPTLDPGALARLTELDPTGQNKLLERVLHAFQTSAARLWPQADAARRTGDHAAIRLVAHTLKSSSSSIGATLLSDLCADVETSIRIESLADLDAKLDAMHAALQGALRAIERLLKARA